MMLQTTCFRSFRLDACSSLCTRARSEHTEMDENFRTIPSPTQKNDNGHSRLDFKPVYYYVLLLNYKVDIIIKKVHIFVNTIVKTVPNHF